MYIINPITGKLEEIQYDQTNIREIDNNGNVHIPDWANKPVD